MSGGGNGEKMVVEIERRENEALGVISASFLVGIRFWLWCFQLLHNRFSSAFLSLFFFFSLLWGFIFRNVSPKCD
jgi:hypothetical protein